MNDSIIIIINVRENWKTMNIPDHPWAHGIKATWIVEEAQGLKRRYVKFPTPPRPPGVRVSPSMYSVSALNSPQISPTGNFF